MWEGVPPGTAPSDAALRERFLLRWVRAEGERLGRPPRVLDVGCGEGRFAAALAREAPVGGAQAQVVAIDVAHEPLRRARELHEGLDLRLVQGEAPLPLEGSAFDVIWAGEVIEHVTDTVAWLSELRRVLRSGGLLLLSTPDHGPLSMLRLALWPRAMRAHFDPRSDHLRFYDRRALVDLLEDFGFEEVEVRGAGGLPGARRVLLASARRRRF